MARRQRTNAGGIGRLTVHPGPDDGLVPRTLDFVRGQLAEWRADPRRPRATNELDLNSTLCDFLDCRSRALHPMVRFKHEALQAATRTVDIGVHGTNEVTVIEAVQYSIYEPFLVLEAKRLPAPTEDREREYVSGPNEEGGRRSGGIQRFKLGLHGGKVKTAMMVGYLQSGTCKQWHSLINQWIADLAAGKSFDGCSWSDTDALGPTDCEDGQPTATAISTHGRAADCLTSTGADSERPPAVR